MPNPSDSKASDGDVITIVGAREHNLKNLSVTIPRGKFVVLTGVSGSGKSTLAFDLLFAEGQRRFLDSMNAYARQFVEQLSRPDVDLISGIPPTVSIEQRLSHGGGKSTVATITELYHFVRLLFARLGVQYCPDCKIPVEAQTRDQVGRALHAESKKRGPLALLAPVIRNRKGFHSEIAHWAANHGYPELRADGRILRSDQPLRLDRFREHSVEIVTGVIDSRPVRDRSRSGFCPATPRVSAAQGQPLIDATLTLGRGMVIALDASGTQTTHSTERSCPSCVRAFQPLDPKFFSYNSSQGWCPRCRGFGELFYLPDVDRGARADAIEESWFGWMEGKRELCPECQGARLNPVVRAVRLPLDMDLEGNRAALAALTATPPHPSPPTRERRQQAGSQTRPRPSYPTIEDFNRATIEQADAFVRSVSFRGRDAEVARDIVPEIRERLRFLREVGLSYLQLGRAVTTLSGGEAQRIRLAAQLGSNLSGVLYVLDEPTIGLHARDNERLLAALDLLKARGNSLVVVEHDEATMRRADHIIDLGPGAGINGGQVIASGSLAELLEHKDSITGQCLRRHRTFPTRGGRRPVASPLPASGKTPQAARKTKSRLAAADDADTSTEALVLAHAAVHNLQDLTVRFPLGRFIVVTGVSGSGKSTLVRDCLLPALRAKIKTGETKHTSPIDGTAQVLSGVRSIQGVYEVDQSPIGRTPRSVPATYVGFFDDIRRLFAQTPEARLRGYGPGRFSFNSAQGRCPACEGAGTVKLEMSFLPPAYVRCETCDGLRFNRETLDIQFGGRNIAQVLDLSVGEAIEFFAAIPRVRRPLKALHDTGLDYLRLGQTSPTLSGGEAQRVKLVSHLLAGMRDTLPLPGQSVKRNLFVLEEPTIGLHMADVQRLVDVLQRLVDAGHTVIVIEHNLDLIAEADWIIDLGPDGGAGGGRVVAEGTPEEVACARFSHTGAFLRKILV